MFKIVAKDISGLLPNVKQITWNFSESGHGKGIPDGVGGTTKRTADNCLAHGADITTVNSFVGEVSLKCPSIFVRAVSDEEMKEAQMINVDNLSPFKETFKVHQYHWLRGKPNEISFKTLSCYKCKSQVCDHFALGTWKVTDTGTKKGRSVPKKAVTSKKQVGPVDKKRAQVKAGPVLRKSRRLKKTM